MSEPNPNNQEAFDIVARHLLRQKTKSMDEEGLRCAYRGANGESCAAGALMRDCDYHPLMENKSIHGLLSNWTFVDRSCEVAEFNQARSNLKARLRGVYADLLKELQKIHDDPEPEVWADELQALATLFRLNPAVLSE